ncbi:Membrane protein involved in the export of O-antigen and teichoic acid [Lishizhenia tianjinensis]|uniref:Membrane protein involved in the export of O-antigen and teichoic acid n=1 Tax=Lishizhenia tianjinensis TaxID=477690 RepID=A0A1I6ZNV1_9FLAO|nr:oligosaccharide flippase family protein [Lishizhenia tianjinensis]SFT64414.1 Membrane protein involved in the export of O-antigen and teichoic acid [Lishizhenia tianjinensis]
MSAIKKLVGQTAIYGLSSIVGRLLNYLLVPLYTYIFGSATQHYGVVSELYAWVAFLMVFLTFGMETTYFRFLNSEKDKDKVFNNSFVSVLLINALIILPFLIFSQPLANAMLYPEHVEYIILLLLIVSLDAITALPLAKLRAENKALKFAGIQFSSIGINIIFNLIFLLGFYDPEYPEGGIQMILMANLFASFAKLVLLRKSFFRIKFRLDGALTKRMLKYAFPIALAGFAFIINETIDRILLKQLLYANTGDLVYAEAQVGIYSACYKLAMLVTIFLQAYRYAAEPFFFAQEKEKDKNKTYVKVMNYFVAALCLCFLAVALNINIFKHFITNPAYHVGLNVVPILLMANIFSGIYINQSIWYKLSNQTKFGAYIAIGGAVITLSLNFLFIPTYGYMACAWTTFLVYGGQMMASYLLGQKHYPIPYNLRKFSLYLGSAVLFFMLCKWMSLEVGTLQFVIHNSFLLLFLGIFWFIERPKFR